MRIFSEKTGKEYKTVEECVAAEKEFDEAVAKEEARKENLAKERKARAKEVEDAMKAVYEARKVYQEKADAFKRDYGGFHMTIRTGDGNPFDLLEPFFSLPGLF